MARRSDYDEEMTRTGRISPYDQIPQNDMDDMDGDAGYDQAYSGQPYDDGYDEDAYDHAYEDEAYEDEPYEGDAYEDEYDGEYDEAYGAGYEEEEHGGLLSSLPAKVIFGVIVALVLVIFVLLGVRLLRKPGAEQEKLPAVEQTEKPSEIVFAPVEETPEPTEVPAPTATPLPIILTNTPTPTPTATPTPTPTPTPVPTPTPTPEPTKVPDLGKGEVNRNANLRESAQANGKVKQTLKRGEAVTIHEAVLDKSGKIWYGVTVDDLEISGWMRDYVVDAEYKIAAPTYTPRPAGTPGADEDAKKESTSKAINENAIGTGRTNKDANVRKIMNGKVVVQLRKGRRVDILSVKMDKNGDLWYEVQPQGLSTIGYVRDYLITLDSGVELLLPTATPNAKKTPKPDAGDADSDETEKTEEKKEESILDREVVGRVKTNRAANVRKEPKSSAALVRQISKGNWLHVLAVYEDKSGNTWYEVATESGKTHGFVRDYVVNLYDLNEGVEAQTYGGE